MQLHIDNYLTCKICGQSFPSAIKRNVHILSVHQLTPLEYILQTVFDNIPPTCKCGCGTPVAFKYIKDTVICPDYTTNHFPRKPHSDETKELIKKNTNAAIQSKYGVDNVFMLKRIQQNIRETNRERYGVDNAGASQHSIDKAILTSVTRHGADALFGSAPYRKVYSCAKTSKIEQTVCDAINGEHGFIYGNKEFDIKVGNDIIEIDGDFWHPSKLENLTFCQIQSAINDFEKIAIVHTSPYTLYKVHQSNLPTELTVDNLKAASYIPDHTLDYRKPILSKRYLSKYQASKGVAKTERYVPMLLKFLRTFCPNFPEIPTNETLSDVVSIIHDYDMSRIQLSDNEYSNQCYNIGSSLLKSQFRSFWKSNYKGSLSPVEAWSDNNIMKRIISYRIGLNDDNYSGDFSLREIVTGLAVNRHTVSFFKPLLAAAIYKRYLVNQESPTVFDPCAGFGGRLLGFKSVYPNGTYIGVEPNPETYAELLSLSANFINVHLYNCKIEEFTEMVEYDFAFTSIPYFDLEDYHNGVDYESFEDWKDKFIEKLLTYDKLVINASVDIYEKLSNEFTEVGKIYGSVSPFNNRKIKKYEVLMTQLT